MKKFFCFILGKGAPVQTDFRHFDLTACENVVNLVQSFILYCRANHLSKNITYKDNYFSP